MPLINSNTLGPASIPLHEGIINNKQTNVPKGMPFKPDTTEQGNAFSIGRMSFMRMNPKMSAKPPTASEMLAAKSVVGTSAQLVGKGGKNWTGASSYIENKRRIAIGKGSLNTFPNKTELTSFSTQNKNVVKSAILKARSSGCVAPKYKGAGFKSSNV